MNSTEVRRRIDSAFEAWGRGVVARPVLAIVLMLAMAGVCISQLPRLTMDTSAEGFLLADDPILVYYNDFRERFARDDLVLLTIGPDDIFSAAFLDRLRTLHDELEADVPYVSQVDSLLNARSTRGAEGELIVEDLFEEWPEDEAAREILRARAMANPIYRNLVLSEDGRHTLVRVRLDTYADESGDDALAGFDPVEPGDPSETENPFLTGDQVLEALAALYEVTARHQAEGMTIHVAGPPAMTSNLMVKMVADIQRFLALAILSAAAVLFILFRRVAGTLIPIAVVLLSLASTLGIAATLGIALQVPTQILPAFLMAVGIGDSVHILAIFYQQLSEGKSKPDAIALAFRHSGFAVLMTSLTTAGALLSFASAELLPVRNLGILAPIGVTLALLYTMVLLPALLAVVPLEARQTQGGQLALLDRVLARCARLSTERPWQVVGVFVLTLGVALFFALQLRFAHDPVTWFPEGDPLREAMYAVADVMGGGVNMEVVFETGEENAFHDPALLQILETLERENEDFELGGITIGKSMSLADITAEIHFALNENQPEFRRVPDNRQLIAQELLLFENSGSDDLEDVTDSQFSTARMTLMAPWKDALLYTAVIREIETSYASQVPEGVEVHVTGMLSLLARTFDSLIVSLSRSYVLAIAIITPLMMVLLWSLRLGLLSMLPNVAPIVFTLAFMAIFDFPLDGFTMLIGSIALGLAVDDTIHFMHGFNRNYDDTHDAGEAVRRTLATSGQAMFVTSCVLCIGFGVFTLGYMNSVAAFGALTSLALALAFVIDVTLAPALMVLVRRGRPALSV